MSGKSFPIRQDPPKPNTPAGVWVERLEPLLSTPGEWYLVFETTNRNYATSAVSELRKRKMKIPEPDSEWEFTARHNQVYAKYNGSKKRSRK